MVDQGRARRAAPAERDAVISGCDSALGRTCRISRGRATATGRSGGTLPIWPGGTPRSNTDTGATALAVLAAQHPGQVLGLVALRLDGHSRRGAEQDRFRGPGVIADGDSRAFGDQDHTSRTGEGHGEYSRVSSYCRPARA